MDILAIANNKREMLSVLWNVSSHTILSKYCIVDNFIMITCICTKTNKREHEFVRIKK